MWKSKENPDIYFFGGMLIAGVLGVVGYLVFGAPTSRTAFASGISAPQLLGGLVKAGAGGISSSSSVGFLVKLGAVLAQFISMTLMPPAFAGTADSIKVVAVVQGIDTAVIVVGDREYKISDVTKLTIPRKDSITVVGEGFSQRIPVKKSKDMVLKVWVEKVKVKEQKMFDGKYRKIMRGIFAGQYQKQEDSSEVPDKKIAISIE